MTDTTKDARSAHRARHAAILAEVAHEEAEAAEAESAEQAGALDIPLHLRIDRELDAQLRSRALAEQIPTSALVRRLLRQAIHEQRSSELTTAEVEQIARRIAREEIHGTR
jgi:predicted HicB family RNase H-like nuclease